MIKHDTVKNILKLGDEDLISMDIIKIGKRKNKYYQVNMKGSGVFNVWEWKENTWQPKYVKNIRMTDI